MITKQRIEDYLNGRTPEQKDNQSCTIEIVPKRTIGQTSVDDWVVIEPSNNQKTTNSNNKEHPSVELDGERVISLNCFLLNGLNL